MSNTLRQPKTALIIGADSRLRDRANGLPRCARNDGKNGLPPSIRHCEEIRRRGNRNDAKKLVAKLYAYWITVNYHE